MSIDTMKLLLYLVIFVLLKVSLLEAFGSGLGHRRHTDLKSLQQSDMEVSERKESFQDSMVQLKAAFKDAKSGKSGGKRRARMEEARGLADGIVTEGYEIGSKEAHMVISVYKLVDGGSGAYTGRASAVLDEMISRGVMPDTMIFNNIIDMYAKCRNGADGNKMALYNLYRMKELGVTPDLLTYTSIITSSAKLGKWKESISLLDEITTKHGIKPDRVIYTAVIKACSDSGRWKEAIMMLAKMKETGIPLDSAACNSVITACASVAKWEAALKVMNFMKQEGLTIDHYTYSAVISACDKGDQGHLIEKLYHEIVDKVVVNEGAGGRRERFAAPLNTVIKYHARVGDASSKGVEVYQRMIDLDISRNEISYTTLITSLAKDKEHGLVVDIFKQVQKEVEGDLNYVVANKAIAGSILHAAAHEKDWEAVQFILKLFASVPRHRYEHGTEEAQEDTIDLFNLVLAIACRTGSYEVTRSLWQLMELTGTPRNDDSYTAMILACKRGNMWEEAMEILDTWGEETSSMSSSSKKVYSACISVLVESKKWQEALSVLDKMETEGVIPSEVTYNSAIEALDASEEYVRAELVFQSALRMKGVYSTWLLEETCNDDEEERGFVTLDLHRLPIAVAKAAVRHALGEMCTGRLDVADLVVITGRGRGTPSRFSSNKTRGLMRSSVLDFLCRLDLAPEEVENNPGRLLLKEESLQQWFEEQERDDAEKRKIGSGAHGNLFLSVARAKKSNLGDVRAVCPFSSATAPEITSPQISPQINEEEDATPPSKCPAHSIFQNSETDNAMVATKAGSPAASRCPAHSPQPEKIQPESAAESECPGHEAIETKESSQYPPVENESVTVNKCPATVHAVEMERINKTEDVPVVSGCPAHGEGIKKCER